MSERKKQKKEVSEFNLWSCQSCDAAIEAAKVNEHLENVHGIKEMKGRKQMLCHMDGADWFQSDYEYTIGDVKLNQSIRCKRNEEDRMYWQ